MLHRISLLVVLATLAGCSSSSSNPPPTFDSTATVSVGENELSTGYVASATDAGPVVYAIAGGADAALFSLSTQGELSFRLAADFESPLDSGTDNNYQIDVSATDTAGAVSVQNVTVSVTNVNEAPIFVSTAGYSVDENTSTSFATLLANDPESGNVVFAVDGGADATLFSLTNAGELAFLVAPDFENAADANTDNIYEVNVRATDDQGEAAIMTLAVTVTDVDFLLHSLSAVPGPNPREIVFSWVLGDPPATLDSFAILIRNDPLAPFALLINDVLTMSSTVEMQLLLTDFVNGEFVVEARDVNGMALATATPLPFFGNLDSAGLVGYFKAGSSDAMDSFGWSIDISDDGATMVVGAPFEDGAGTNIDGDPADNLAVDSGAVYIFRRVHGVWVEETYLKAPNTDAGDRFGISVSISAGSSRIVVGAPEEASTAAGVNGNQSDNAFSGRGAAYVFLEGLNGWQLEAYLKPSTFLGPNSSFDFFGSVVEISGDGATVAVSAPGSESNATGINGNENDQSIRGAGAIHLFVRSGTSWAQQAYIKAPTVDNNDRFGRDMALSYNGDSLLTSSEDEDSGFGGINVSTTDNSVSGAGAAYLLTRSGTIWAHDTFFKEPVPQVTGAYGRSVAINDAGDTVVVGAPFKTSADSDTGVMVRAGGAYVYTLANGVWSLESTLIPNVRNVGDHWGAHVAISRDGQTIAMSGIIDGAAGSGLAADASSNAASSSGAVVVYRRQGAIWTQSNFVKASNTASGDRFGISVSMDGHGSLLAAGSTTEDSDGDGIGSIQTDDSASNAGAVYIY